MPFSDRARADSPRYRATAMDRVFADSRIVALTGPSTGQGADAARSTLASAQSSSGASRVALEPRSDSSSWRYRTDLASTNIDRLLDADTNDLGRLLTDIRHRSGGRDTLDVLIRGNYMAIDYSHGIGDGQMGVMLLAALSNDRDGSRGPALAVSLPPNATWQALRRHYRAHPAALRQFWQLRNTHKPRPTPDGERPEVIEDWESGNVSRCGYMRPEIVRKLEQWRKAEAKGATSASVSVALWTAALRAENVDVDDHVTILFNSRRYLGPEYAGAHGNFAVAIPLHLPATSSPADIAHTMRAVIDSGWPIAVLGMSEIKDRIASVRARPGRSETGSPATAGRRFRVAVSDLGRLPMFDHVEWSGESGPPQLAASLDPDGPDGSTMLISELGGGRTYTASFCRKFLEPDIIDAALHRLCNDPVGLLDNAGT